MNRHEKRKAHRLTRPAPVPKRVATIHDAGYVHVDIESMPEFAGKVVFLDSGTPPCVSSQRTPRHSRTKGPLRTPTNADRLKIMKSNADWLKIMKSKVKAKDERFSTMTWVVPKLWSNWDQTCAREAGWCICHDTQMGTWKVAKATVGDNRDRFKDNHDAFAWVCKMADKGSARHERALRAVVYASLGPNHEYNRGDTL